MSETAEKWQLEIMEKDNFLKEVRRATRKNKRFRVVLKTAFFLAKIGKII